MPEPQQHPVQPLAARPLLRDRLVKLRLGNHAAGKQ
jgi:hypothetical protein